MSLDPKEILIVKRVARYRDGIECLGGRGTLCIDVTMLSGDATFLLNGESIIKKDNGEYFTNNQEVRDRLNILVGNYISKQKLVILNSNQALMALMGLIK